MLNLVISEMQIKTTMRYHYTNTRMTILKKTKNTTFAPYRKNILNIVGKDIKWYRHFKN